MNKAIAAIFLSAMLLLVYLGYVVDTYKPITSNISQGELPKQPITSDYELPQLTPEEDAVTDSIVRDTIKQVELESEHKSIETMRNEVIKILDETVEQDSSVVISFNMQWTPSWVQ